MASRHVMAFRVIRIPFEESFPDTLFASAMRRIHVKPSSLSVRPAACERQPYGSREIGQWLVTDGAVSRMDYKALIIRYPILLSNSFLYFIRIWRIDVKKIIYLR